MLILADNIEQRSQNVVAYWSDRSGSPRSLLGLLPTSMCFIHRVLSSMGHIDYVDIYRTDYLPNVNCIRLHYFNYVVVSCWCLCTNYESFESSRKYCPKRNSVGRVTGQRFSLNCFISLITFSALMCLCMERVYVTKHE
jgi:hypothetical protein